MQDSILEDTFQGLVDSILVGRLDRLIDSRLDVISYGIFIIFRISWLLFST